MAQHLELLKVCGRKGTGKLGRAIFEADARSRSRWNGRSDSIYVTQNENDRDGCIEVPLSIEEITYSSLHA